VEQESRLGWVSVDEEGEEEDRGAGASTREIVLSLQYSCVGGTEQILGIVQ
jgi:hypothetical protein